MDELYFEDDDAAMAAYEEAIRESMDGSYSGGATDDDDFEPDAFSRHKPKAQRTTRGKKAARRPRKTRAAGRVHSSSPAPVPKPQKDDGGEANTANASAIPTPDIGALRVASSVGSPSIDAASVATMDTDDNGDDISLLSALRRREQTICMRMEQLEKEIADLEKKCGVEDKSQAANIDMSEFLAPKWSVPIRANVMNFEWERLAQACQFDVILMDPPWQLASQAPTRGVAIAYQQLPDVCIESLPIQLLQTSGFIFIWVINNKYTKAFQLMKQWGYTYVDDITWVKQTVNRRMAKGHGYYLQHAKETCLVGKKGADPPTLQRSVASDIIFSERRGQSQKPEEMYEIIEQLVPGGNYLEIFGRKNNLRDYWVTIGNEL
ncbi:hypothetical protein IWW40_005930 [Coemansia sp. RSA 1250]|nr:hypothetical protein IWW40_005930 [Coemansia sp. RSA 1250]